MVDFKTKKTRVILVLTPFYPLGLIFFIDSLDSYLEGLVKFTYEYNYVSLNQLLHFLTFGNYIGSDPFYPIIAIIYLSPIYLYWIIMPIIRFIGRWIARGE